MYVCTCTYDLARQQGFVYLQECCWRLPCRSCTIVTFARPLFHELPDLLCVYTNVCMYIYIYCTLRVYMCMHKYINLHTQYIARIPCIHTYIHIHITQNCVHKTIHYIHTYTHTHIRIYISPGDAFVRQFIHTYIHTYIRTHTDKPSRCVHKAIHSYIHTYIRMYISPEDHSLTWSSFLGPNETREPPVSNFWPSSKRIIITGIVTFSPSGPVPACMCVCMNVCAHVWLW